MVIVDNGYFFISIIHSKIFQRINMKPFVHFICILASSLALFSCGDHHHHDEDHHAHLLSYCTYSDSIEMFLTASPIFVGEETHLTAHFTSLANYKPVSDAQVDITVVSQRANKHKLDAHCTADGIYSACFTPQHAENVTITIHMTDAHGKKHVFNLPEKIFVAADEEAAEHYAEEREVEAISAVHLPKEISWNMDFSVETPRMLPLGDVIHTVGKILPGQSDEMDICASVSGKVILGSRSLTSGQPISQGQTICTIDATGTASDNLWVEMEKATAEYEKCRKEYLRISQLAHDRLVTATQLEAAKRDMDNASAVYNNLKKHFSSGKQYLSAPESGFIKNLYVRSGQYVTEGTLIATISQCRSWLLQAEVSPGSLQYLHNYSDATLRLPNSSQMAVSLKSLGGHLVSIGKQVNEGNTLVPVVFSMSSIGHFVPGVWLDMYISTQSSDSLLTVPSQAVMEEMGTYFVFVQLTPELFEKRYVKIGATDGLHTTILEGILPNDRIVTKGAVQLKLQQSSGTVDPHAGHNHG